MSALLALVSSETPIALEREEAKEEGDDKEEEEMRVTVGGVVMDA